MNKNIFLILVSFLLVSCGVITETKIKSVDCSSSVDSSVSEGAAIMQKLISEEWETPAIMGIPAGASSLKKVDERIACQMLSCKNGYKTYSTGSSISSLQNICVKSIACKDERFLTNEDETRIIQTNTDPKIKLDMFLEYVTNTTNPSCIEEDPEFSCADPNFSIDSSDPENLSCVPNQTACSEEERPENSSVTEKIWNTESNSYGECSVISCNEGYSVSNNSCVADPIYGCMDSRADNFNPEANTNDMSCLCADPEVVYNPETGCDSMPIE